MAKVGSAGADRRHFRGRSPCSPAEGAAVRYRAIAQPSLSPGWSQWKGTTSPSCSSEWDCRHFGRAFTVLGSSLVSRLATRGLDFFTLCRASKDSTTRIRDSQLFRDHDSKQNNSLGPKWCISLNSTCQDVKGDSNPLRPEVLKGTKLLYSLNAALSIVDAQMHEILKEQMRSTGIH